MRGPATDMIRAMPMLLSLMGMTLWATPTDLHAQAASDIDLTAPPTNAWPTNGGNIFNQRHSPLTQIDRNNVQNLRGVWRARLDGSGSATKYSGEAQPIIEDGVLYIVTGQDDVFAIDIETGNRLWKYQSLIDQTITTVCCGWLSRGVGLGDGKVFVGQLDGQLKALDQQTGDVIWAIQAERWQDGYTITSAPLYYDGLVIVGFAGAEKASRGRVKAYTADTGALVWTFFTVPSPGEFGHDTWPADNDAWRVGGASVWQTPAIDPELGLLFFSTGNAGPDYNGSVRPGDNLFSASILALDVKTGEYRWHFQQVHHDIWDYDSPNPVVLFDIEIDGVERHGIAQASKTGWVYILDRETGEPLIGIEERAVPQDPRQATSATQPYPIGDAFVPQSIDIAPEGYRLINGGRIFTPFWTEEAVVLKPALSGGANWAPSSYDPTTGYLYVCASDRYGRYQAVELPTEPPANGTDNIGGTSGMAEMPGLGTLSAIDMRTNKIVWQQAWPEPCAGGGTMSTASGLLFVGRKDGRLTALDSASGASLWEFQTGAGMESSVSTFEHNGRQYVAAYSAGNALSGSVHGDSVWLFGLEGSLEPVPEAQAQTDAILVAAPGPADIDAGAVVFANTCVACHGQDGRGGHNGAPTLHGLADADHVIEILNSGSGDMPAFNGALTPVQIRDVGHYVFETFEAE